MKKFIPIIGLIGLFAVAAGGVTYAIKGSMESYVVGLLWIGLLSLLYYFYVSFPELKASLTGRTAKYGVNTAVMILVFFTILVLISYMSSRYKVRWDLTATKRYTLSDQSKKIVKALKKDVSAVAFYRSDERTRQAMEDLLLELSQLSPRFKYQFIDPDKQPGAAAKYGVTAYRTTLIRSGNNQQEVGFESEERLANAILKVTRDEVKTVYSLKGHGENDINDFQNTGYKAIKEAIEKENYQVKDLAITGAADVPEDCALLVVSGPKKDLLPDELARLTDYINRGGSVIFMLDPAPLPKTSEFLNGYGFRIGNDIVIDKMSQVFGANYLVPVVTQYEKEHPVTGEFNIMTFFPLARSVEIDREPTKGAFSLAMTGEASWGETDRKALEEGKAEYNEGREKKGPLSIAAVVTQDVSKAAEGGAERKAYGKIFVVGDSDFVNNTHVNLAGNKDFFLNTLNWLTEEAELISIRKKDAGITPVILTASQGRFIFWIPVVVVPSLVLVAGVAILTRRRISK
jgi:ABC-type uncharacterized transport system involved in gliding motility auxiliary subunit